MTAVSNNVSVRALVETRLSDMRPVARYRWWFRIAMIATPIVVVGCGSHGDIEKVVVTGSVSYGGKPIQNGEIRFYPLEGTAGPVSGGPIRAGRYEANAKGGVPVGKHRVVIEGYRTGSGSVVANNPNLAAIPGGLEGPREQFLPQKYNKLSALVVAIESQGSAVTQDFQLEP